MAVKLDSVNKSDKNDYSPQDDLSHLAQAIISSAGVGIYIVQHGKFVYVSELYQKLSGYTDTELIGTYSLNNIYPDDRKIVREEAIKCLKRERFEPYEYRFVKKNTGSFDWQIIRKDGTKRYIEASISLKKDSSYKLTGL